jgi:DNA-binding Lrp family transcriptional regulator
MYAYILVEIPAGSPRDLEKKIQKLHRRVVEARSVYGSRYDIVVKVKTKDPEEIDDIVDMIQRLQKGITTVTLESVGGT